MDDKALLRLIEEDPECGIALMTRTYRAPLYFAAAQHLTNAQDIKECIQDTFADFYLRRERFDPDKGNLRGYLVAIAQRKAIRRYHEEQRQWRASLSTRAGAEDMGEWEQRDLLESALDRLPELDQKVLRLRYFQDRTLREIADELGLEYETAKKRAQRALEKLIRLLEE